MFKHHRGKSFYIVHESTFNIFTSDSDSGGLSVPCLLVAQLWKAATNLNLKLASILVVVMMVLPLIHSCYCYPVRLCAGEG